MYTYSHQIHPQETPWDSPWTHSAARIHDLTPDHNLNMHRQVSLPHAP